MENFKKPVKVAIGREYNNTRYRKVNHYSWNFGHDIGLHCRVIERCIQNSDCFSFNFLKSKIFVLYYMM